MSSRTTTQWVTVGGRRVRVSTTVRTSGGRITVTRKIG